MITWAELPLSAGDPVAYIPPQTGGDPNHKSFLPGSSQTTQRGTVVSKNGTTVMVRFGTKGRSASYPIQIQELVKLAL